MARTKACPRCKAMRQYRGPQCAMCTTDLAMLAAGPPKKKEHKLAPQGPCRTNFDDDLPQDKKPLFWLYYRHYMEVMAHMPEQQRSGLAVAVARNKILHPRNKATAHHMKYTGLRHKWKLWRYRKALERLDCIQRGVAFPAPVPRPARRKDFIPPQRSKVLDIG